MESITVSLAEGSATVSYDPSVTDPQTIAGEGQCVVSGAMSLVAGSHSHNYSPPLCETDVLLVLQVFECVTLLFVYVLPDQGNNQDQGGAAPLLLCYGYLGPGRVIALVTLATVSRLFVETVPSVSERHRTHAVTVRRPPCPVRPGKPADIDL